MNQLIYEKLESFIKKFYLNELLRGLILFFGLGLLYFLFTLIIEYFLWLSPNFRSVLFWSFITVEFYFLLRFILFPLSKLFKFQKGIDYTTASQLIGNHFSQVNDKLLNFLQLSETSNHSELLLASIDQKAKALQPIPFTNAIDFKANKKHLPILLLPLILFLFFYLSGNSNVISQSFNRVVHYNTKFVPPAPFTFKILTSNLATEQYQNFEIKVVTTGKFVPEQVTLFTNDGHFFMESSGQGVFTYVFEHPVSNQTFHLEANNVSSSDYTLQVFSVPSIQSFDMTLHFPEYIHRPNQLVKGNGNLVLPEGTQVTWNIAANATDEIIFSDLKSFYPFSKLNAHFNFTRLINSSLNYEIKTSNAKVFNFETLHYQLSVIKDQFPTIAVSTPPDSLKLPSNYLFGKISDDYGFSKLQIVYFPKDKPSKAKRGTIPIKGATYDQFVFSFPGKLPVEAGITYDYYFEVYDNDVLHHYKKSVSSVYSNRILSQSEIQDEMMNQQNANINSLEKSIQSKKNQLTELDKLQKFSKEKDNFDFKDQQKLSDFIERQKQQDALMKQFTTKIKEHLDQTPPTPKDAFKESLQKRIENAEKEIDKNSKLLDELKELQDKIKNDEFVQKLDKFKQNAINQSKNLQQLVELTKKFYVEKKAEQIANKLDKLATDQDKLSNDSKENTSDKQQEINKDFNQIKQELDKLSEENKDLKAPLDLPNDSKKEESIEEDLNKAKDELQKQNQSKAKPKQQSASKKMKEMSAKMKESMAGGEQEQLEEDVQMLRQVLDNLLAFSFSQEDLLVQFRSSRTGSPSFNKNLKLQQNLKQQFKHIDDSLFALSLRNEKIAENITKEIGTVHYNLDKSTDSFVDSNFSKGISHQQYVISAANRLADFLSDILNNLQMSMNGSGSGSGKKPKPGDGVGMQLSDIIKKQQGLGGKMGTQKSQNQGKDKGGDTKGESGQGKPNGKGDNKQSGQEGKDGQDGEGDAGELMRVYQEQKQLREALQKELEKKGLTGVGQNALDQMKQLEKQLLNRGLDKQAAQKSLNIQYELMKLEKAVQQQGEDQKRQSNTNKRDFIAPVSTLPKDLLEYINTVEILNRQALPLQKQYNERVQHYFKQ